MFVAYTLDDGRNIYTREKAKWEWSNYAMLDYVKFVCYQLKDKVSSELVAFIIELYKDSRYRSYKEKLIDDYMN